MLDDKDEFDRMPSLQDVRDLIARFKAQEEDLIRLHAESSGTEMILARLRDFEQFLVGRELGR